MSFGPGVSTNWPTWPGTTEVCSSSNIYLRGMPFGNARQRGSLSDPPGSRCIQSRATHFGIRVVNSPPYPAIPAILSCRALPSLRNTGSVPHPPLGIVLLTGSGRSNSLSLHLIWGSRHITDFRSAVVPFRHLSLPPLLSTRRRGHFPCVTSQIRQASSTA
jgi:hypothetical protein